MCLCTCMSTSIWVIYTVTCNEITPHFIDFGPAQISLSPSPSLPPSLPPSLSLSLSLSPLPPSLPPSLSPLPPFLPPSAQVEIQQLKDKISFKSKENFKKEQDLRYLDSKIALLIAHKISADVRPLYSGTL